MICYICGKDVSSVTCSKEGQICNLCNYLLTGKKMNPEADYSIETKEGIVLWVKDLRVTSVWLDGGMTVICLEHLKEELKLSSLEPINVISFLRKLIEKKTILCSDCGNRILRDEIAGSHFAGVYCKDCWERYKEKNSRICGLCRSPMYRCCC